MKKFICIIYVLDIGRRRRTEKNRKVLKIARQRFVVTDVLINIGYFYFLLHE